MWRGPYIVEEIVNEFTYKISHSRKAKQKRVHANRLKPYYGPSPYTVAAAVAAPLRAESPASPVGGESLQAQPDQEVQKMLEFADLVQDLMDADPAFESVLLDNDPASKLWVVVYEPPQNITQGSFGALTTACGGKLWEG
jgi:hypothetical protein